uniref:Reverse transcriptase zinc-binding domain-containing protein n=1 Tax=Latimeria chalumnae TaxID=7897 RepID=H3AGS3_LATCH
SWSSRGITRLGEVRGPEGLLPFASLQDDFGLPSAEFLHYLQLKASLSRAEGLCPELLPTSPLVDIFQGLGGKKWGVSRINSTLLTRSAPDHNPTKQQWEKDLGHLVSEGVWEEALSSPLKSGTEVRSRLVQFRLINQLYWSPSKLAASGLRESTLCWRCGKEVGSLLHMIWVCEAIHPYWEDVLSHIREVSGVALQTNPLACILGVGLRQPNTSKLTARFVELALISAKRLLVKHWRQDVAPALKKWLLLMADTASHECVLMKARNKLEQFNKIWSIFLNKS